MDSYTPSKIEPKWQKIWAERGQLSHSDRQKFYCLVEFPYPSGAGLHVGHVRAWSAMDAYVRKKRMEGFNVLFPMGWDAFGLPAENYAIKKGVHPSITTAQNIANFKRQIQSLGLSFDWGREINTTDPKYYKWTQWIFLKLLEKGLAYQKEVPVNWCPACRTNLADEEVLADGTHERCGQKVEKRLQKQWLLAITKYADRLIEDLKKVDFPSKVAVQQVNWIGRSEGATIRFSVLGFRFSDKGQPVKQSTGQLVTEDGKQETDNSFLEVFTTRPDTIYGATFLVVAPEHPLVAELLSSPVIASAAKQSGSEIASGRTLRNDNVEIGEVRKYVEQAKSRSEEERIAEGKKKTGVDTGLKAINPATGKEIPIFVSDYVLSTYGTGAIMAVPAHDERDLEFAKEFKLPVIPVIEGEILINSGPYDGQKTEEARKTIVADLEKKGLAKPAVTYHLHDWIFSRQHYWGEPIPVIHCKKCGVVPVPEKDLPVELPYVEKYEPSGTGESPLSTITDWVNVACPVCGGPAKRETDTMPNWAGSNWYYLGYLFADQLSVFSSRLSDGGQPVSRTTDQLEAENRKQKTDNRNIFTANKNTLDYWMPVDVYEGGYEHTTLHLLYSRFIYKFLFDIGIVPGPEPYAARRVHGIVLGPDNRKMSKSFGNVLNPDEIVEKFGADTLRIYEMFMGPFAEAVAWNDSGAAGVYRFLNRVYSLFSGGSDPFRVRPSSDAKVKSLLSKLVRKVTFDLDNFKFNTAVAAFMEFTNELSTINYQLSTDNWDVFLRLLAPFAPHLAEELWQRLREIESGKGKVESEEGSPLTLNFQFSTFNSIHHQPWPKMEVGESETEADIVVQVDGKMRDVLKVQSAKCKVQSNVEREVLRSEKVKKHLEGKSYKVIFVAGKLINFVTG